AMFEAAVEDDLLIANPAHRLRKKLRLGTSKDARAEEIRALTQDELDRVLATARECSPALFPLYLTLARTGLRIGGALGLDDTDQPCSTSMGAGCACSVSSDGGTSSEPRNLAMGVTSTYRRTSSQS